MQSAFLPPAAAVIGADHAGRALKDRLKAWLTAQGYTVTDTGTDSDASSDYPIYAAAAARAIRQGDSAFGVLVCGSGQGMCMAANRFHGVRAALCQIPAQAELARRHNDANVLTLGARFLDDETAEAVLEAFLASPFEGGRHARRVSLIEAPFAEAAALSAEDSPPHLLNKGLADMPADAALSAASALASSALPTGGFFSKHLQEDDPAIYKLVREELGRQQNTIELIASENIVSLSALEAQGTVLTNKYAEGYPGKRYYGGCEHVDGVEALAIERACRLFECGYANVQPNSGSQANQAVMLALLQPGDTVLGLSLACGGHLTHGAEVNLSGKWFKAVQYGVSAEDALIDFAEVERLAKEHKPKLIIAGCSAYPRVLDWKRFADIAESVGAFFMVDMAHMAGLVAGGSYPSPLPFADVVTSTTHKTLRGPRGGLILSARPDKAVRKTASGKDVTLAQALNSAVFPGLQGGPLMHVIAAKAVAFGQALRPEFKAYAKQVKDNAEALAKTLSDRGVAIVSGGTDSHVVLADLRPKKMTGKAAEEALERAGLTCNKNAIPFDPEKPFVTSGVRLGTPAGTTRGFGTEEFKRIGNWIVDVLEAQVQGEAQAQEIEKRVRAQVEALCKAFPVYPGL